MNRNHLTIQISKPLAAIAGMLALLILPWLPGCGGQSAQFSKETRYTPESLAQEFVFRYKTLPEQSSPRAKARLAAIEKSRAVQPGSDRERKSAKADLAKAAKPQSVDTLVEEFSTKLANVSGTSKQDATKAFLDQLSKEQTIGAEDLKLISGALTRLAQP